MKQISTLPVAREKLSLLSRHHAKLHRNPSKLITQLSYDFQNSKARMKSKATPTRQWQPFYLHFAQLPCMDPQSFAHTFESCCHGFNHASQLGTSLDWRHRLLDRAALCCTVPHVGLLALTLVRSSTHSWMGEKVTVAGLASSSPSSSFAVTPLPVIEWPCPERRCKSADLTALEPDMCLTRHAARRANKRTLPFRHILLGVIVKDGFNLTVLATGVATCVAIVRTNAAFVEFLR